MKEEAGSDTLLFLGWETFKNFYEDAEIVSRELGAILTSRAAGVIKSPDGGCPSSCGTFISNDWYQRL